MVAVFCLSAFKTYVKYVKKKFFTRFGVYAQSYMFLDAMMP